MPTTTTTFRHEAAQCSASELQTAALRAAGGIEPLLNVSSRQFETGARPRQTDWRNIGSLFILVVLAVLLDAKRKQDRKVLFLFEFEFRYKIRTGTVLK